MTPKTIKNTMAVIFTILALLYGSAGIWAAFTVGVFSSRAFLGCSIGTLMIIFAYKLRKEIKENRLDTIRTLILAAKGFGVPLSFGFMIGGIMEKDIWTALFSGLFLIFFASASRWIPKYYNFLNNLPLALFSPYIALEEENKENDDKK